MRLLTILPLALLLTNCTCAEPYDVEVDVLFDASEYRDIELAAREWEACDDSVVLQVRYAFPSRGPHSIAVRYAEHLPTAEGFNHEADGFTYREWAPPFPGEYRATVWLKPETSHGVKLHELGHALGLQHSDNPADVMHIPTSAQHLSDGDRQALLNRD